MKLEDLPTDILIQIFKRIGVGTWPSVSQVCRRFHAILGPNSFLWFPLVRDLLIVNSKADSVTNRSFFVLPARERLRVYRNWRKGICQSSSVITSTERHLQPWLQLESRLLWVGMGNTIKAFKRIPPARIRIGDSYPSSWRPSQVLVSNAGDLGRYAVTEDCVVAGSTYGSLFLWRTRNGRLDNRKSSCHNSDITAVDARRNLIATGSRDRVLKIWDHSSRQLHQLHHTNIGDRIISLRIDPSGSLLCTGSAGHSKIPPAQLYDLHTGKLISNLRSAVREGEGVYDIHFESNSLLLTAGFDSALRLWDLRLQRNVLTWEDPHDSSVNCLATDDNVTMMTGTSTYGGLRLWDKRHSRCVQLFFVRPEMRSPVYSIAFDPTQLFVALDAAVLAFDFTTRACNKENVLSIY